MKTLVAGWFSFAEMGATAGDLLARDVICEWLRQAGCSYDVAMAAPFAGGVDWAAVDPHAYSDVVFVCGPFGNGWPIPDFLARFSGRRLTGVDVSLLEPLDAWNPFDLLLERDSTSTSRPDISLLASSAKVPVVGVVLVHHQLEYRNGLHDRAHAAIERLIAGRSLAAVRIDTRLDVNATGLRTPAEVESLIARMDVVVTTRLHGLVLAIKNNVPVVAIDPVIGGAKVTRQAQALGWPCVLAAETLSDAALADALNWALGADARRAVHTARSRAAATLNDVRDRFLAAFAGHENPLEA
jgi:hypothetical protein